MNNDFTIDLNMLAISLNSVKARLSPEEFEDLLEIMQEANDKDKLIEYLEKTRVINSEGTDLATALRHAHIDLLLDPGKIF